MNLYEVNAEYQKIIDECRISAKENEGEISSDLVAKLDYYAMERDKRIENVMHYYKNEDSLYNSIMTEIDALARRAKFHENNAHWAKAYLMAILGEGNKMEFPTGRISWRKSSHVEISDMCKIPEQYLRIIPERREPDKNAIKDELKQGKEIEGTFLAETQNIIIK